MQGLITAGVTTPTIYMLMEFALKGEGWAQAILVSFTVAVLTWFGFDIKLDFSWLHVRKGGR